MQCIEDDHISNGKSLCNQIRSRQQVSIQLAQHNLSRVLGIGGRYHKLHGIFEPLANQTLRGQVFFGPFQIFAFASQLVNNRCEATQCLVFHRTTDDLRRKIEREKMIRKPCRVVVLMPR